MKKILLIGKFTDVIRSINDCLIKEFQVQLSTVNIDNVKGVVSIFRPNLIIVCHVGEDNIDSELFQCLDENCPATPVLVVATQEEWNNVSPFCQDKRYEQLLRPVNSQQIMDKCCSMLKINPLSTKFPKINKRRRRMTILVVDDSAILLRNIKSILEQRYEVVLANSGKMALNVVEKEPPDMILLDYMMPEMNGKETFENLRKSENGQDIPVIFLTSVDEKQKIFDVLRNKPDGYILKPPDRIKLVDMIEEVFDKYR